MPTVETTPIAVRHPAARFHLAEQPWLPLVDPDQGPVEVSLATLLRDGHQLASAVTEPLFDHALTRYLTALGYLAATIDSTLDWRQIAVGQPLPPATVDRLLERLSDHLWLFHPETPFLQTPSLLDSWPAKTPGEGPPPAGAWDDKADPIDVLVPHVPAKSQPAWFNRSDPHGDYDDAALARIVLARHYWSLPGNQTANSATGGGASRGSGIDLQPPGIVLTCYQAATWTQQIACNLAHDLLERTKHRPEVACYWEDPAGDARRADDPLWVYTATCDATLLVDDGRRAIRSPVPVAQATLEARKPLLKAADPHALRAPDRQGEVRRVQLDPAASQYRRLEQFHARAGARRDTLEPPSLVRPHGAAVTQRPADTRLVFTVITGAGSATNPTIVGANELTEDPSLYLVDDPDRAEELADLISMVGGATDGLWTTLRGAIRRALDSSEAANRARDTFWTAVTATVNELVDQVLHHTPPDGTPDRDQTRALIEATVNVYDQTVRPYEASVRRAADIARHRNQLRSMLWTRLT